MAEDLNSWFTRRAQELGVMLLDWIASAGGEPYTHLPHRDEPKPDPKKEPAKYLTQAEKIANAFKVLNDKEKLIGPSDISPAAENAVYNALSDIAELVGHTPALTQNSRELVQEHAEKTLAFMDVLMDDVGAGVSDRYATVPRESFRPFVRDGLRGMERIASLLDPLQPEHFASQDDAMDSAVSRMSQALGEAQMQIMEYRDREAGVYSLADRQTTAITVIGILESEFSPTALQQHLFNAIRIDMRDEESQNLWKNVMDEMAALRDTLAEAVPPSMRQETLERFYQHPPNRINPNMHSGNLLGRVSGLAAMASDIAAQQPPGILRDEWEHHATQLENTVRTIQRIRSDDSTIPDLTGKTSGWVPRHLDPMDIEMLLAAVNTCANLYRMHILDFAETQYPLPHAMSVRLGEVQSALEKAQNPGRQGR